MSFAFELARRASAITLDTMPPEAGRVAARAFADTIGTALAGCRAGFLDGIERALEIAADAGPATKIGRPGRCHPLQAAVINGTAAHALDFDDCSTTMGGHPSAPVVPALLALAQDRGSSGRAVLSAYLAGVELELRLARAVMPHHYEKGWHPTATLGVFGAATASAHLLGLDPERMATALAIAVSMASGLKSNFGTPIKPLHVGQAAYNGLLAATLSEQGVTASHSAFEHEYGFFNVLNGAGTFDPQRALGDWLTSPDVLSPGIAIKQHPCCGSAHSAIDAALTLHRRHGPFRSGEITAIETWTHRRRLAHTDRPRPKTGLEAKFSVQFLTAKALTAGIVRLGDFDDSTFLDADTASLAALTRSIAHDEPNEYLGRVKVTLGDGRVVEASASTELGRGPLNPMSDDELEAKFVDCAGASLGEERARSLFRAILALDQAPSIEGIMTATQQG
ncbi:MmgE/PrpD family protein [Bosea sp. UNC402CLCol]|uniref:MmgE/PrpD family protein n=1 Tax=Bosea sp. UNC402CLCol TaxID=1510531 RepID=UPI000570D3F8|nr:MmgE/PrpD family protein [Bosea sp. UNC402CLCol]